MTVWICTRDDDCYEKEDISGMEFYIFGPKQEFCALDKITAYIESYGGTITDTLTSQTWYAVYPDLSILDVDINSIEGKVRLMQLLDIYGKDLLLEKLDLDPTDLTPEVNEVIENCMPVLNENAFRNRFLRGFDKNDSDRLDQLCSEYVESGCDNILDWFCDCGFGKTDVAVWKDNKWVSI